MYLELIAPNAASVLMAGSFNDWRPAVTPMIACAAGRWAKVVCLAPGRYEYCFVVDGQWMADPAAGEFVANPFGGVNSVLKVAPAIEDQPARATGNASIIARRKAKNGKFMTNDVE